MDSNAHPVPLGGWVCAPAETTTEQKLLGARTEWLEAQWKSHS
jgi:hypothetical protein